MINVKKKLDIEKHYKKLTKEQTTTSQINYKLFWAKAWKSVEEEKTKWQEYVSRLNSSSKAKTI